MKSLRFGRFVMGIALFLFGVCFLSGSYARPKPADSGYHLLKTVSLPPAPGGGEYYDYISVDPEARRVYVSHGTEVVVLNADDDTVVGKIEGLNRCHGIAIARDLGKGFISDGDSKPGATVQEVVIFDLKTMKVTGRVSTGQLDTDAIIYEPVTKHVYTFNGDSHNSTVIDPAKQAVITTIDLVGKVEFPAVDGKGMLYDNNPEKNDIVAIDARTNTIKSRWPTDPAGAPTSMAIDQKNRRLFSAGRGPQFVIMMDADNGKVLQSYPISAGVDANAFDAGTGLLFVATREGMMHIYHEDSPSKLSEVQAVKTEYGAKTLQVDPKTHKVFLSTSDFNPPAAPTEKQPHPLPTVKPGNFRVLVYGR
ncbi:MAG TPA: YncE family protein [Verrucomicrobiae bacterium]|jgi:DNA-binding beta-propeller fold protein YncE|nr:YncE family protein [Verrucomicrobiae bacterium]